MLYMVVERFKNGDAAPIYKRFREQGRMTPGGLNYVSSWVDEKMHICFQLMDTEDRALFDEWISRWEDLVEFEVFPLMTSAEAATRASELGSHQTNSETIGG